MCRASQPLEAQFWKLCHAIGSMHDAALCLDILVEKYSSGASEEECHQLWTGFFIAYARPFTNNHGVGILKSKDFIPAEGKERHSDFLLFRNTAIGHTDFSVSYVDGSRAHSLIFEVLDGKLISIRPVSPSRTDAAIGECRDHIETVGANMLGETEKLFAELNQKNSFSDGLYSLDLTTTLEATITEKG